MDRKTAEELTAVERIRQITGERWTPEHDDEHDQGEMLRAAVFYFQHAARPDMPLTMEADGAPLGWMWDAKWWKPKGRDRDLIRAGALCMAERDRLRRLKLTQLAEIGKAESPAAKAIERDSWWPEHVKHKFELIVGALCAEPATADA